MKKERFVMSGEQAKYRLTLRSDEENGLGGKELLLPVLFVHFTLNSPGKNA